LDVIGPPEWVMPGQSVGARMTRIVLVLCCALGPSVPTRADDPPAATRTPPPGNDLTFRPTVIVRRGKHQGSGTVIASIPGESLVLTASHVLEGDGALYIEVHRYNLGLERRTRAEGWPREVPARVVARDRASDLAVIRVEGFEAMPYVARIAPGPAEPPRGEAVVSVGIDLGEALASWGSRVFDYARIDMGNGGGPRPFLLVEKPPEHGRSGGGLFTTDGTVVGVCVGRAEIVRGRRFGVFASSESIRRILHENNLEAAVARSVARRTSRPAPSPPTPNPPPPPAVRPSTSG
jgi:S1-C subfamily serine protease